MRDVIDKYMRFRGDFKLLINDVEFEHNSTDYSVNGAVNNATWGKDTPFMFDKYDLAVYNKVMYGSRQMIDSGGVILSNHYNLQNIAEKDLIDAKITAVPFGISEGRITRVREVKAEQFYPIENHHYKHTKRPMNSYRKLFAIEYT